MQQACQAINTTINMENDDRPNFFKLSELNNNPEIKIKNESLELNHGQMGQIITSGGLQVRTVVFWVNIYGVLRYLLVKKIMVKVSQLFVRHLRIRISFLLLSQFQRPAGKPIKLKLTD